MVFFNRRNGRSIVGVAPSGSANPSRSATVGSHTTQCRRANVVRLRASGSGIHVAYAHKIWLTRSPVSPTGGLSTHSDGHIVGRPSWVPEFIWRGGGNHGSVCWWLLVESFQQPGIYCPLRLLGFAREPMSLQAAPRAVTWNKIAFLFALAGASGRRACA